MKLVVNDAFDKAALKADAYTVEQGNDAFSYRNVRVLRTAIGATCAGATHEHYAYPASTHVGHLSTLRIDDVGDGGCKENKFQRDIQLLRADIAKDPGDGRAHFYLANSYRDTRQWAPAIDHYHTRIQLGGWYEEVWYSYYALGKCYREADEPEKAVAAWLGGYQHYPRRAENLYELVKLYRETGMCELAARFYRWATSVPEPNDGLFLHHDVYQYLLAYELTVFFYYVQDKSVYPPHAVQAATYTVLARDYNTPNVWRNYQFYAPVLARHGGVVTPVCLDGRTGKPGYDASTPSACVTSRGTLTNVRYNNTVLDDEWNYVMRESREVTYNAWILDSGTNGVARGRMNAPVADADEALFAGRQDVRLFAHGTDTVLYTATVCAREQGAKVFRIEYGEVQGVYDAVLTPDATPSVSGPSANTLRLHGTRMASPTNAECEKNWSLFEDATSNVRCVYSWHPLVVGRLDGDQFVEDHRTDVPVLRHARGSSHGTRVVGRPDVRWFLVHFVSYESPRRYYHAVVETDDDAHTVHRLTYPFTFEGEPIEYAGSLAVDETHLTVYYSVKDAASRYLRVPRDRLTWTLPP
jgi:tetratricopeptide (TPR) repeat protein